MSTLEEQCVLVYLAYKNWIVAQVSEDRDYRWVLVACAWD